MCDIGRQGHSSQTFQYFQEDTFIFKPYNPVPSRNRLLNNGLQFSFSEKDLSRIPESFRTEAGKIASRAGGSLSFDSKPAPIESGFILSYGGIEENCSLKSIFAANKDQIQDTAMKVLFS